MANTLKCNRLCRKHIEKEAFLQKMIKYLHFRHFTLWICFRSSIFKELCRAFPVDPPSKLLCELERILPLWWIRSEMIMRAARLVFIGSFLLCTVTTVSYPISSSIETVHGLVADVLCTLMGLLNRWLMRLWHTMCLDTSPGEMTPSQEFCPSLLININKNVHNQSQ